MCNKYSNIARQKKEKKKVQLTKDDAFVYWSSSYAVCWWPIFRKLGTCSTTDNLSPRTLLTKKNFCESVQEILQYRPAKKKKKTKKKRKFNSPKQQILQHSPAKNKKNKNNNRSTHQTWCLSLLVLFLSNVEVGNGQETWRMLLRTDPLRSTSHLGQYWQKTFVNVFTTYCNISRQQCPF